MTTTTYPQTNGPDGVCQSPEMLKSSTYYPRILTRLRMALWFMEREGLLSATRRVINEFAEILSALRAGSDNDSTRRMPDNQDEVLNLKAGEWVEVKSKEEILKTLDEGGGNRGLRFVPEMFEYCGQHCRVLKRVEKICIENTPDIRRIRNTVLLEGGICKGGGMGCDRSCFHFWREVWLSRVPMN